MGAARRVSHPKHLAGRAVGGDDCGPSLNGVAVGRIKLRVRNYDTREGTGSMRIFAFLLGVGLVVGCATPENGDPKAPQGPGARPPRPAPCTVDDHGNVVANGGITDGGKSAMCCPPGYVAGGYPETRCPAGACCDVTDDMPNPPPMPLGQPPPPAIPEPPRWSTPSTLSASSSRRGVAIRHAMICRRWARYGCDGFLIEIVVSEKWLSLTAWRRRSREATS